MAVPRSSLRPFDVEWASTCARLRRPPCRLTAAQLRAVPVFQNNPRCARLTPGCRPTCARRTPARAVLQLLTTLLHSHSVFGGWRNAARATLPRPTSRARRAFVGRPFRSPAARQQHLFPSSRGTLINVVSLAQHAAAKIAGRARRGAAISARVRVRARGAARTRVLPAGRFTSSRICARPCAARVQHNSSRSTHAAGC